MAEVERGGFLEWVTFDGHLYGTPLPDPPPGSDVVLEIDVEGAKLVRGAYPGAVTVLVVAPSEQAQAERLRSRGDDETDVARRLAMAEKEVGEAMPIADHVVVNDDVARAVAELESIIRGHRLADGDKTEGA